MLCHQCGSPVDVGDSTCQNCGATLQSTKRLKLRESRGIRISQEMKAIKLEAQHFPPGEEIEGRYVLAEMIGKGPFGEVYRANDQEIDADVAIKVFDPEVIRNPRDRENFLNTTRAARSMTQSNVVRIHQSGFHKDHPWVSMQHLEGLSLRKVLDLRKSKNENFQLEELEPIVSQITLALQHVARDFPHGDLKPENIIFLPDLLKVTDAFLLASLPAETIIPRLKESSYLAPELHTEKTDPDAQADVYSVGVIIGEMMFGPDYTPGSHSEGQLSAIDALVKRATAFDPKERYPSVEALSEDLATLVDTGALLGPEAVKSMPPPPPSGPGHAPPMPPPGAAPVDPVETAKTVEVNRSREPDLQDAILTEEVQRSHLSKGKTATAAVPKPSRPVPKPRPQSDNSIWGILGPVIALFAIVALIIAWQMRKTDDTVEQIGQNPAEVTKQKNATKPPAKSLTTTPNLATAAATTEVADAKSAAVAATSTNNATAPQTKGTVGQTIAKEASGETEGSRESETGRASAGAAKAQTSEPKETPKPAGTDCPGGMVLVKSKSLGNYCIDRHEYPGGGVIPRTGASWFQAKKLCASKGKRLCELKEWRSACGSKYPYGGRHDADKCNTADEDGFERSLGKTGAFKRCRSRSGAYDMVGNAHEWVAEQRIAGGGFESDDAVGSCSYSSPKSPASTESYVGFRCCADPQ